MTRERARHLAEELVGRMTAEEKAGQLRFDAPAIERLGIPAYNWWNEGLHGLARGGTATSFPQAIGMAAMFDEELMERIASVISDSDAFYYLDAPIKRVGGLYCPVPFNPVLEANAFPTPERIEAAIRETL